MLVLVQPKVERLVLLALVLAAAAIASYVTAPSAAVSSPPPGTLSSSGLCENNDCMRSFDGCWFYRVEQDCSEDAHKLVGFERQRSACFNAAFWACIDEYVELRRGGT